MKIKINNKKGFTLFEMLVVISIIGILSSLIAISFSSAQKKARDSKRVQDMKAIQTAAEQFYSINNFVYPAGTNAPTQWTANSQTVLDAFPRDPRTVGWTGYAYGIATTYCACAAMESVSNGNSLQNCNFSGAVGGTGPYFCVKSQQ